MQSGPKIMQGPGSVSSNNNSLGIPLQQNSNILSNQASFGSSSVGTAGGGLKNHSSFGSSTSVGGIGGMGMGIGGGLNSSVSSASFLQSEINMNDPAVLRKRISELEQENKRLKEASGDQA